MPLTWPGFLRLTDLTGGLYSFSSVGISSPYIVERHNPVWGHGPDLGMRMNSGVECSPETETSTLAVVNCSGRSPGFMDLFAMPRFYSGKFGSQFVNHLF